MLAASRFPASKPALPPRQEGVRISATTVSHTPRHYPPPPTPTHISSHTFHIHFHPPHSLTSSAQACYPHPPPSYCPQAEPGVATLPWSAPCSCAGHGCAPGWRPCRSPWRPSPCGSEPCPPGSRFRSVRIRHCSSQPAPQSVCIPHRHHVNVSHPAPQSVCNPPRHHVNVSSLLSQCAFLTVITPTSVSSLLSQCASLTVITSTSARPLLSQCPLLTVITSLHVNVSPPAPQSNPLLTVITSLHVNVRHITSSTQRQSATS